MFQRAPLNTVSGFRYWGTMLDYTQRTASFRLYRYNKSFVFYSCFRPNSEQAHTSALGASDLNQRSLQYAKEIRDFKLDLLRRHLIGETGILWKITYGYWTRPFLARPPAMHPVHYHLLWIPDAAGHTAAIPPDLDPVEKWSPI